MNVKIKNIRKNRKNIRELERFMNKYILKLEKKKIFCYNMINN